MSPKNKFLSSFLIHLSNDWAEFIAAERGIEGGKAMYNSNNLVDHTNTLSWGFLTKYDVRVVIALFVGWGCIGCNDVNADDVNVISDDVKFDGILTNDFKSGFDCDCFKLGFCEVDVEGCALVFADESWGDDGDLFKFDPLLLLPLLVILPFVLLDNWDDLTLLKRSS